jgi:hypothetical protein
MRETHAMHHWFALGIFVLGAGAGALTTAALYLKQIRQLKDLLEAEQSRNRRTVPQTSRTKVRGASGVSGDA